MRTGAMGVAAALGGCQMWEGPEADAEMGTGLPLSASRSSGEDAGLRGRVGDAMAMVMRAPGLCARLAL